MENKIIIKEEIITFDEKALENLVACKESSNYELHFRLYRVSETQLRLCYAVIKKDHTSLKRPRARHKDVLEIGKAVVAKLEEKYTEVIYYDFTFK